MTEKQSSNATPRQKAEFTTLTSESSKESEKLFRFLRAKYFGEGIQWMCQFVKKRDGIHPKTFAQTAYINEDRFSQILNGKVDTTVQMFTRIAIGIGLFWDEIVELRLARFHECQTSSLSDENKKEVRLKRIDDLKNEFIFYFGNDARAVLDMLDNREDLLATARNFQGKYIQRFHKNPTAEEAKGL